MNEKGQVLTEYVIMLVLLAVFTLALMALMGAFSSHGSRLIDLVSWDFP